MPQRRWLGQDAVTMRLARVLILSVRSAAAAGLATAGFAAQAGAITPDLERALSMRGTHAPTAVIVRFNDPVDVAPLAVADRRARDNRLLLALKERTTRARSAVESQLVAQGARRLQNLWIVNGVAATLPAFAVRRIAELDGIERIELDSFVQTGRPQRMPAPRRPPHVAATPPAAPPDAPVGNAVRSDAAAAAGWNIVAVHAPELWELGHTGRGVVVATIDTGVDLAHPDLLRKWRGGANSWFDPHGEEAAPYDALGHGTQAMGIVLGSHGIGIAPDARWIATRLYDADGRAHISDIHRVFQWLMDPDGDPATIDAPDVVNASWTLTGRPPGSCIAEFSDDIRALRASGIAVVFAAGNDGPRERTSSSPANNAGAVSVGAVERDLTIARQSSRGPSSCDGGVFPRLVAPGTNVRTADLTHGGPASYGNVSGSSLASPHVVGVLALLIGAFPAASVTQLEAALVSGARDLGEAGPDDRYGYGLVDAMGAFNALRAEHAGTASTGVPAPASTTTAASR